MHGLFLALPAILLSPKRAMRQLCSLCSHNAQPLGTCRQPLNAVGRLILLSPKRAMRQLCSLCSHNAQPLGTCRQPLNAVGRLILLSPKRCSCVKLCSLRSHNCASRLGRAANRLTRLDVYSFPIHPVFAFSSLGNDINPAVYYIPAGWLR